MSTPVTRESAALSDGDLAKAPEPGEWRRQLIGLIAGVILAALVYFFFPADAADTVAQSAGAEEGAEYSENAMRIVAATTVLMAAWWVTEAIPLAATALLPIAVFPLAGVAPFKEVSSPYASATIFLFMGGFLMALGLQRWNLHRRLALMVVKVVGTSPKRIILGFMLATGFMSMCPTPQPPW